jgi:uncharacterized protein
MRNILADTGPLVALFNKHDAHHARALAWFKANERDLVLHTTWEVISEACYFLNFSAAAQGDFLEWLHAGHAHQRAHLHAIAPDELPAIAKMMRKYADRPMDLADASLVHAANKTAIVEIITIDRADFSVYRTAKRKMLKNVFED